MRIQVDRPSFEELRRAQQRFRRLPKEFRRTLQKYQRQEFTPIWRDEIRQNSAGAASPLPQLFKTGNTVAVGVPTYLKAANSRKKASSPRYSLGEVAPWFEFGTSNPDLVVRYWRASKKGNRHKVTRHVARGLPARRRSGYVTGSAMSGFKRRAAKLHAQTLTKAVYEILGEQ